MKTLERIWRLIGLPEVAITMGLLATVFLIVGSLAIQLDPPAYAGIPAEDVSFVWRRWSPVHSWLPAAAVALALFAASSFVCTIDSLRVRLRHRVWAASAYAVPLMHLGFLIGLGGHLVSAVGAEKAAPVLLAGAPAEVEGLGLRLIDAKVENGPTGEPRHVDAKVEVTDKRGGAPRTAVRKLGFNHPIILDAGRRLVLLMRAMPLGGGAGRFEVGGRTIEVRPGEDFAAGQTTIRLVALFGPPEFLAPLAKVRAGGLAGGPEVQILRVGQAISGAGSGIEVRFLGTQDRVGLVALVDRNAGAPVLFAGMLVFTAGLALFVPARMRRSQTAASTGAARAERDARVRTRAPRIPSH